MSGNERNAAPISERELQRRWAAVRKEMNERSIDALIMQNSNDFLGGYVKYFTDVPAHNGYPRTVIFYADDFMTVVEMGPFGKELAPDGKDVLNPGVGRLLFTPSFFSVAHTHDYDVRLVIQELKRRDCRTVGMVGPGALPHAMVIALEQELSERVHFVDATDFVDQIKAVKSDEEIALIRRAAQMQDRIFEKVLTEIKPGMRDSDLMAVAQYEGQLLGSEQGIFRGSSAPMGRPAILRGRHFQGRVLQPGEYITLLIENNGPGGFYAELARTMVLGKASEMLKEAFEAVREAQKFTVDMLTPGAAASDIYEAHNAFMRDRGLPPEMRLYSHGQGYDLVERPLIRFDERMKLKAGMSIAVHPGITTLNVFAFLCDNFLIHHTSAAERLHKTEARLFELL